MTDQQLAQAFDFAKSLAVDAGVVIKRYFQAADIGIEWKEDSSPVTVADHTVNDMVIKQVKAHYPEHGVIGEEGSFEPEREWVWVVDPIDGTSPFSLGMPLSTFCLALVHAGEVQLSVVFDPFQDRMFTAQLGKGAHVNGVKISVSSQSTFDKQYAMTFRSQLKPDHQAINHMFDQVQKEGAKIYMFASFSYAGILVAEGNFVMACMQYGSPWDAAAISLIVQEAGGMATDIYGNPRKYNQWGDGLLLSNGKVHDRIIALTNEG